MRSSRPLSTLVSALVLVPLAGCAFDPPIVPPPPPIVIPQNDSPQNTMTRFQMTYQRQLQPDYVGLLTTDFRYTFSAATDPTLVAQYGLSWGKDDEAESSDHLFNGFTSTTSGEFLQGASNISISFYSDQYFDDPNHPDSAAYYKWVPVPRVVLSIEIPGATESQIYNIDARHEFYLVRGDAAWLEPGQEARSDRWYIQRWDDLSAPLPGAGVTTTWGDFKDAFIR